MGAASNPDPIFQHLRRVPENELLCQLVEQRRPQAHSDLVDELDLAAAGLPDFHVWCPDPRGFSFCALYRSSGQIFAFASGMLAVSLRVTPARLSEALADGGEVWEAAGPGWASFRPFDGPAKLAVMRERIRRWCAAAHEAAGDGESRS